MLEFSQKNVTTIKYFNTREGFPLWSSLHCVRTYYFYTSDKT